MEEITYNYFSNLISYSSTNNLVLVTLSLFEIDFLLPTILEVPIKITNIFNSTQVNEFEKCYLNPIKKISIYHRFQNLRNDTNFLYPKSFFLIILLFFFLYFLVCFFCNYNTQHHIHSTNIKKQNIFGEILQIIFYNIYDHGFFRSFSLISLEIIINSLVYSNSLLTMIIITLLLIAIITFHACYYKIFRLCQKFDKNCKYVYDPLFMRYYDYFLFIIYFFVALDNNIPNISITYFFNVITCFLLLILLIIFINSNCVNFIVCFKGFITSFFLLLIYLYSFFSQGTKNATSFCIYFISCLLGSFSFIFLLRNYKINVIINSSIKRDIENYKASFDLLYEYYETNKFTYYFKKIVFSQENIVSYQKIDEMIIGYLKNVSKAFKSCQDKMVQQIYYFYYILSKIFRGIIYKKNTNFTLLFRSWKIMKQFRKVNYLYYINVRYFYEKLCKNHISSNHCNYLVYNSSFYSLYKGINQFITELKLFISTNIFNMGHDYLVFSEKVKHFKDLLTENYNLLAASSFKDEYQKNIYRLIIEGLFNHPMSSMAGNLLVHEEILKYEELLERRFNTTRHMVIRLKLDSMKSKIIKIGKEFIQYLNKPIDFLFPTQLKSLGKKIFYNEIKQTKETLSSDKQVFNFVIIDNNCNLKNISYSYNIYPNLQEGTTYIEGFYQVGKENLILTKKKDKKEFILLLSKQLENQFLISQELSSLLNNYKMKIYLQDIISNTSELSYNFESFSKLINRVITELFNVCSKSEKEFIKSQHKKITSAISGTIKNKFKLERIRNISDEENGTEFNIYSISIISSSSLPRPTQKGKENTVVSQTQEIKVRASGRQKSTMLGSYDNSSMTSQSSSRSGYTVIHSLTKKKNDQETRAKHNNYLIIVFNICLIALSVFCLIYEDQMNKKLESLLRIYKTASSLSRVVVSLIVHFLSVICPPSENGKCESMMKNYFLKYESYMDLYDFSLEELKINIDNLPTQYSDFKKALQSDKENMYSWFFENQVSSFHFLLENGSFSSSYYSEGTFHYSFKSFSSKLILISHDEKFPSQPIYPLKLNNTLFPYDFADSKYKNVSISLNQKYIYEVLISFYTYINELYGLSQDIEDKISKRINQNYLTLSCFVGGLVAGNFLILFICLFYLRIFEVLSNIKLNSFSNLLANKKVIEILREKIEIISNLSQLFYVNPCKVIPRLGEITKNKLTNQAKNENEKVKDTNITENNEKRNELQEQNFKTGQLSINLKIILYCFFMVYIIYSLMFVYVYTYSFHELRDITKTLLYSANAEENIFLFVAIFQMFHYFAYEPSLFFNIIPKVIQSSSSEETNFIVILLNQLQTDWKNERDYKNGKNSIPTHQDILNISCDTIYKEMNDTKFNYLINKYPQKNYEQKLINYCKEVNPLKYGTDKLLVESIIYQITKLLLMKDNYDINSVSTYNMNTTHDFLIQLLFIYRPLRTKYSNYYFQVVLEDKINNHFLYLISFLLGCIILQVINFLIINCIIFNKIENVNLNFDNVYQILKCI